ncbi:MAG: coproporphyrinogen III oxidase, partial [Bacteroidetes bacterium]
LSLYALTVEEKTALGWQVQQQKVHLPEDESFGEQFLLAHEQLSAAGYVHYELSNYAKPGFRSRHNMSYWEGKPYLGLGPSAHSYDQNTRAWNLANNSGYLRRIAEGQLPTEEQETLSPQERYHEYIMTQLRRQSGIDVRHIESQWKPRFRTQFADLLSQYQREGLMEREGDFFRLTPRGWLVSDRMIRDFF